MGIKLESQSTLDSSWRERESRDFHHEVAVKMYENAKQMINLSEKATYDPFNHHHKHICTRVRKKQKPTTEGLETFCTSETKTSNYSRWHENTVPTLQI